MWIDGLLLALSGKHLLYLFSGSVIGLLIGAAPGLGPVFGLALFLSMTFSMSATEGLIFLSAIYASSVYGGSISAVLLNTPGTPGNIATTFDGFPLAKKGEGGRALGAATMASFAGGVAGVVALMFLGPVLAELSLKIGPAEYFMLALAGLSLVSVASKGDTIRGLLMGGLGLMLAFVGRNVITGSARFTFNTLYLEDGIPFVPIVIGAFAFSQAMVLADEPGSIAEIRKVSGLWTGIKETLMRPFSLIRGAIIGVVLGILPGVGINAANFISYLVEKNTSKHPESFGEGNICGVIAPETANNASTSATLIPAFGLGIPGGSSAALFLSALMIHGITPGYDFFKSNGTLFPTVIWGMLLAQVMFLILGVIGTDYFVKITLVPNALLVPSIMLLSFIGSFALRNRVTDVFVMVLFGIVGYYLSKFKYPLACLVLGIILGDLAESNFNRALRISHGSLDIFVTRPISLVLFIIIIMSLLYPYVKEYMAKKSAEKNG